MKTASLIILGLALMFAGCQLSSNPGEGWYYVNRYPLVTGNSWDYAAEFGSFNFRPIVPGADSLYRPDTLRYTARVVVVGQKLLRDNILAWEIQIQETQPFSPPFRSSQYYVERGDSLILIGYTGGGLSAPKSGRSFSFMLKGIRFSSIDEVRSATGIGFRFPQHNLRDSIYYEQEPVVTLLFPLNVGVQWSYRERAPFRIDRIVESIIRIDERPDLNSGFKIRWKWDIDANGQWDAEIDGHDIVNRNGLMRRSFLFRDFIITHNDPTPVGYVDAFHNFVLTGYNISGSQ